MAIKKTELYRSLWASCDELRGGMDASQYKDYVLSLLFVKYVSDKYAGDPHGIIMIPEGGSFEDMKKLDGDKEIGDKINKIISKLAEDNDLKSVIDVADFNDEDKLGKGKDMVDRLSKLIGIFSNIDFSSNRVEGDDLLGDAYEYLMRHFATESGKSKGQFYTPAEVSRILAKVVGISKDTPQDQTVYDPTCGSGSLLLKAADEAPNGLTIYGQENDNATSALARMNMILHNYPSADIWKGNTLASPHWKEKDDSLKTFYFAVANPPFSHKAWTSGVNINDDEFRRFEYGVPPNKNGDYAFLLHLLKSLKPIGKGAIILPHGVLFRGNVEADIRRKLIRQGYVKGIIGLPTNLFYGTGIPACIIVIDKENSGTRKGIFMVDASKGFIKDGNKNRLRSRDIHKIVDVFNKQIEVDRYSRMVSLNEIEKNEYNLNIPRYIDSSKEEDIHDLFAHLNGGIPIRDIDGLEMYWRVFPTLRKTLFADNHNESYCEALISSSEVKNVILNHQEFKSFFTESLSIYKQWFEDHRSRLKSIQVGDDPKALILKLSEDLLNRYATAKILDKYAVYQILMDYWEDTMQDDCYIITHDGWKAETYRVTVKNKQKKDVDKGWACELIPKYLVINRYFAHEKKTVDKLIDKSESLADQLTELVEEHSGEDDHFADYDKVSKTTVQNRLKEIKSQEAKEEKDVLNVYLSLFSDQSEVNKAIKAAEAKLDQQLYTKYPTLTQEEIQTLVIENKWNRDIQKAIEGEIERVTQDLAKRVKELEERYAEPLPKLEEEVKDLKGKVENHLKKMGLTW